MFTAFPIIPLLLSTVELINACIPTQQIETTAAPTTITTTTSLAPITTTSTATTSAATSTTTTTTTTTVPTTTTTAIPCPTGWDGFERPSGPWCLRVYISPGNRAHAFSGCSAKGGSLSGVQNQAEIDYMASSYISLNGGAGFLWVGAQRTSPCLSSNLDASCTTLNSFEWTDGGKTTGTDGFIWQSGQPDNGGAALDEACCLLSSAAVLSDEQCLRADPTGYVCGQPGL
ncbi:C-type lectin domain-containing protein [Caenorhabditis elegans]|uniref:C-type lectin domain-containing protein n=1 Tax=Caenorhabditis elegans TaxID=6239 RepID=D5MCU6_CAEEL|nr:C-type lectin domain-containing protein [Caenorhabditis elegans]CBL43434.1 C-type lectin domain-containing protein [Caenorhabditis elegans]|eukprot:NP_001256706.1 C-type LECtin [Caenorhabditis elegans]